MNRGHRIKEFEEPQRFIERIQSMNPVAIACTDHALFRLSEKQRKVFTEARLKRFLNDETPIKVGIQYNGCFAAYYPYSDKDDAIRIVVDIKPASAEIITFYIVDRSQIPRG